MSFRQASPATAPRLIILWWVLTVSYAALIFHLSSLSKPAPFLDGIMKYHTDALLHGVEYGVLGWLLMGSLTLSLPILGRRELVFIAWVLCVLYAVSDEWHQSWVPGREASSMDLAADAVGGLIGIIVRDRTTRKKRDLHASHPTV
ncbi:MAG: hypothetical protein MOGMAGMI_00481 [Candidatus Omnitrophica bacterium]|nr:hypothetical protein [Candidatus Omnitrophota bacterium]